MTDNDLDELATYYKDGPVHESLMAAKALRDQLDRETDPLKQEHLNDEIRTWVGLIQHEIEQVGRSDDDPDDYVKYLV